MLVEPRNDGASPVEVPPPRKRVDGCTDAKRHVNVTNARSLIMDTKRSAGSPSNDDDLQKTSTSPNTSSASRSGTQTGGVSGAGSQQSGAGSSSGSQQSGTRSGSMGGSGLGSSPSSGATSGSRPSSSGRGAGGQQSAGIGETSRSGLAGGTASGAGTSTTGTQFSSTVGRGQQSADMTSARSQFSAGRSDRASDATRVGRTEDDFGQRSGDLDDDDRAASARDYWDDDSGPGPKVMAADTLTGDKVVNGAGETLGEISDIMIDVPTGRVAYAVLSSGGFLGIGDKLFAIPWRALQLDPENHQFVLNVDKERLENAPGFDKDSWPSMADETWANEVHSYYGSRPHLG